MEKITVNNLQEFFNSLIAKKDEIINEDVDFMISEEIIRIILNEAGKQNKKVKIDFTIDDTNFNFTIKGSIPIDENGKLALIE